MFVIVEDCLFGGYELGIGAEGRTGVWVPIKSREIAAGHLKANAVTATEEIGRDPKIDFELLRLARFEQRQFIAALTIAGAHNALT